MKDLLIFVPLDTFAKAQYEFIPIGPLTISSFVSDAGFEVDVVHGLTKDIKEGYKYYGISSTTAQYTMAKDALLHIRRLDPTAKVIIGGPHFNAKACLDEAVNDGWDYIVVGDGEIATRDILAGKETAKVVYGTVIDDIDSISLPDYGKLDLSKYNYPLREGMRCINIMTSRGCPFKCVFCSTSGSKLRQRSSDKVMEEVEILTKKYGFDSLLFVDDTMSINNRRYYSILSELESFNIKWRAYGRTTTINKEGLERMARSGCIECCPGIESGSQEILDLIGKGTNAEKNIEWCKTCEDVGIVCSPFIIIGLPNESMETVKATERFVREAKPSAFAYNILMPFPDSPLVVKREKFSKYLTIYPYTWDDCITKSKKITDCFVSTPYLSREDILKEYYRNYDLFANITGFDPRKRGTRANSE